MDRAQVSHIAGGSLPAEPQDPGINQGSPALQADSIPTELLGTPSVNI